MKSVCVTTKSIITKIKDVNRLVFHIFFPMEYSKDNIINKILLKRMLYTGSKKYNTPEKLGLALDSKLIMSYNINSSTMYNQEFLDFRLCVPKEGIVDDFSLDEALDLFHEMIFNPNIDGEAFNNQQFNYEKDYLISRQSEFPQSINEFAYEEFSKFIDPDEIDDISHDTYMKLLNEVTPESVYNYYEQIIKNNSFFTFIGGAFDDEEKLLNTFNKYFNQEEKEIHFDIEFFNIHKVEDYQEKVFKKDYNQSMLCLHYNFKGYTEDEYIKLSLLSFILDAPENNLLFNKLRRENNLIYTFNFRSPKMRGFMDIILYLDKNDIDKAKELVDEVFDSIKDKELFETCKNRTIKAMGYDLLSTEDDPFYDFNIKMSTIMSYDWDLESKIERIKEVSYDDMMEFLSRMVHTKTMIIEGGDNHE
jgi:predicted Zn-dependent peptidase